MVKVSLDRKKRFLDAGKVAYARNAIIHHGRLDKGVLLITKPFSSTDLAAKIRDVLDEQA